MALIKIKQVSGLQAEVDKIVVVSDISSRDLLIDVNAQGYASDAEGNAISTAAADATSKANTAESNAISTASTAAGSRDALVLSTADTAAGSRDALITSAASTLSTRVDDIEATLIQDNEFAVEILDGVKGLGTDPILGKYQIQNNIQGIVKTELMWVSVNGMSVEVDTINGHDFTLVDPGYPIEAGDDVKVHYQYEI